MNKELQELNHRRLEAEKAYNSAKDEASRWQNEANRRGKLAVSIGEEWIALKIKLGLLPKDPRDL